MGLNTTGMVRGKISEEELLSYIKTKYDSNAESHIEKCVFKEDGAVQIRFKNRPSEQKFADKAFMVDGTILFNDKDGNAHRLYMNYTSWLDEGELEMYKEIGDTDLIEMASVETTYLSLGYIVNSVSIMEDLILHFGGGWLSKNDVQGPDYMKCSISE